MSSLSVGKKPVLVPPIGEKVRVQCETYRTMAYRDEGGVWRTASNGKELTGIIKVEWPEEQELGGA
jgi:hypothetical protein